MSGSSGYPAGEGNGLDSLFAQLRNQQSSKPPHLESSYNYYTPNNNAANNNNGYFAAPASSHQLHGYQHPSATSEAPTPQESGPQPHHSSAIMSPVDSSVRGTPATSHAPNDGASHLLNLLKFSQPSAVSPSQQSPIGPPSASMPRATSFSASDVLKQASASSHNQSQGSDLLATLMGSVKAQQTSPQLPKAPMPPQSSFGAVSSTPEQTQAYLLRLLNQPKPPQSDEEPIIKHEKILTPPSKAVSEDEIGEVAQALEKASLEMNMMGSAATEGVPGFGGFGKENARDITPNNMPTKFTYHVNPFEQLAASSPRNRTPKNTGPVSSGSPVFQILKNPRQESSTGDKRKSEDRSAVASPAHSKRKLELASQSSSKPPTPVADDKVSIKSSTEKKESVQDAIGEIGGEVDKQVQEALARADQEESAATIEQDLLDMLAAKTEKEFEDTAQVAAQSIKKELEKEENSGALDDLPVEVAEAVKDVIDEAAQGHIADSWESADNEDSPVKDDEEALIKVYNFPMRPWTSITVKQHAERLPSFNDDLFVDIARLKKEFDQVDRTLVTASNNFIAYGMSKNGGLRIIRQLDGTDTKLFTETHDRIFNVVVSASSAEQKESIIGIGISGAVYWALVKDGEGDHVEDGNLDTFTFALPPIPSQETEAPGGVLKTRARKSASHPDFFAVGRGKFINVIWPGIILKQSYLKNGKDRLVDTDKYLAKHSLKVNTGKAGKDFTFSEDDTIIVSLDKAGRVKFWDVRSLTNLKIPERASESHNIEIKDPLITLITTPATEKSWPTSVMFVDKLRPFQRGCALRYLVVGMKQNHTLQLWDLALGKPVQEIHLPHSKESDAACSVVYHAATGMIVVGHPTRNSIYFLHLSAPKYTLPKNLSQADYMQRLVANDPEFKKPESTAVMSGMREYSFESKGQLRSLDILQTPNSANSSAEPPRTLFELYVMHSKGVTCLNIKPATLGWTSDNKVIYPVFAEKVDMVSIDTLKEIPATLAEAIAIEQAQKSQPTRVEPRSAKETSREPAKKSQNTETVASTSKNEEKLEKKDQALNGGLAQTSGPDKNEKKKRRKGTQNSEQLAAQAGPSQTSQAPKPVVMDPMSNVRNGNLNKAPLTSQIEPAAVPSPSALQITDATLKEIEARVTGEVKTIFGDSIDTLYKSIRDDRKTQTAMGQANQEAMLRLVSATLNENIEQTLGKIINNCVQQTVLPAITEVAAQAVTAELSATLSTHLAQLLPKELAAVLPDAINKVLHHPQLLKLFSDALAGGLSHHVDEQFKHVLASTVVPNFQQMTSQLLGTVQHQAAEQINALERQRQQDNAKIEQLTQLVAGLGNTITTMAQAQAEFQAEFLKLQAQNSSARQGSQTHVEPSRVSQNSGSLTGPPQKSQEEIEYDNMVDNVKADMDRGDYENAVIKWLQTKREQEIFGSYFVGLTPDFVRDLTPLLLLSLGATISIRLDDEYMNDRIAWMEAILASFQTHVNNDIIDDQVRELIPKIMGIYTQRVEHLFMRISQIAAKDPALKRLSLIVTNANKILETSRANEYYEGLPAELAYPQGSSSRHVSHASHASHRYM